MADAQGGLLGWSKPQTAPGTSGQRAEGPERKLLTILFVDIVSSSALVVGRDPEEADAALLSILSVLVEAVGRYDGTVSQLLGDGFMAVFGAPDAKEDHTLRACLAAQDIIRTTAETDIPGFRIRVGLDSGDAVAQVVRSGLWSDYRTVGECVHVAAKLQQRADPNTAQLSRNALDLVPVGVSASPAGRLVLAPGAPPVLAYTLEGARAVRRTAADLLSSTRAPLVGRETERALLFEMAAAAARGTARTLVLRGDAGIGKSRLVGELLHDPKTRNWGQLHWPQMPVRRLGDPDDLEAVAQSLAVLLTGTVTGDGPARVAEAAGRKAGSLAGDAVRSLFGLPARDPLWSGLDPAQRLSLAIDGLVGAVLDRAACLLPGECPLLILIEDAHWARPVMGRLLDALTEALTAPQADAARHHVLLLATMRPPSLGTLGAPEGWTPPGTIRHLDLEALNPNQSRRFLDHWLGSDPSLADLKSRVSARSQGVPLYLEEILRSLEAAGDISGSPGAFRLVNSEITLQLPRTVHALLASRIDRLDGDPRRVLLRAAVVGSTFDFKLLRSLQPVNDSALPDELAFLEQAGFVTRARLLPNLEFVFRHALIREVAYSTLTISDRKTLHGKLVGALRERRESDLPNRVDLLAHHAFKAELWPAAYAYGRRAGLRAESRSKLEDASEFYKSSLHSIRTLPQTRRNIIRTVEMSVALPRVNLPRGLKNMDDYLSAARELALNCGDSQRHAQAASLHAAFEWTHGDLLQAEALSRQGLATIGQTGSPTTRIQLLVRLGAILGEQGRFLESCQTLTEIRKTLAAFNFMGMHGLAAMAIVVADGNLARSCAELNDVEQSIRIGHGAVEFAEDGRHIFSRVYASTYLGWSYLQLGMPESSIPHLENALRYCEATRSHLFLPFIRAGLGFAQAAAGQVGAGMRMFEEWREHYASGNPRMWTFQAGIWLAETMLIAGRLDEAREQAVQTAREAGISGRRGYRIHAEAVATEAMLRGAPSRPDLLDRILSCRESARRLSMSRLVVRCDRMAGEVTETTPVFHESPIH